MSISGRPLAYMMMMIVKYGHYRFMLLYDSKPEFFSNSFGKLQKQKKILVRTRTKNCSRMRFNITNRHSSFIYFYRCIDKYLQFFIQKYNYFSLAHSFPWHPSSHHISDIYNSLQSVSMRTHRIRVLTSRGHLKY